VGSNAIKLPPGFQLEQPQQQQVNLPPGFVLESDQSGVIPPQQPGFFKRLGESLGVPTSMEELKAAQPSLAEKIGGPPVTAAKILATYAQTTKRGFAEGYQKVKDAGQNIAEGGPIGPNLALAAYGGVHAGLQALPFIGPAIEQAGEDIHDKNYRGAAGGLTGVVGQVALPDVIRGASKLKTPSALRASAGQAFDEVQQAVGTRPVNPEGAGQAALRAQEMQQAGRTMPRTMSRFLQRVTTPDAEPLSYREARDFYKAAGELSANDKAAMTPEMRRQLNIYKKALGDAIEQTTKNAGVDTEYGKALSDYAKAKRLEATWDTVWSFTKKRIVPALLVGGAAREGYKLYGELSQ
jgi:hypothetical protein